MAYTPKEVASLALSFHDPCNPTLKELVIYYYIEEIKYCVGKRDFRSFLLLAKWIVFLVPWAPHSH
jgi:hypothetical protein